MAKQPNSVSSGGESFMVKLATFIVDKRNLFFLITIILVIFSMFSRGWVEVENDLTFYLPEDSETKKALNVMEGEFITYGTAEVMVANISYADAESMLDDLKEIRGVQSISFDDTTDHYNNASALFSITFDYDENGRCVPGIAGQGEGVPIRAGCLRQDRSRKRAGGDHRARDQYDHGLCRSGHCRSAAVYLRDLR